jgi:O-antigen/teichoic acid export membrane protein
MPQIGFITNANGVEGAAISTSASIILLNVLFLVQANKFTAVLPFRRKMLNIALASIIPAAIIIYLRKLVPINFISMAILSIAFFAIYFGLVLLLKGFDKNDWILIRSASKKVGLSRLFNNF